MTRGSVRLRLTVLFASLFLAAGAGLLGITYGLVSHATNGIIVARFNGTTIVGQPASGQPTASGGSASDGSGSTGSGSLGLGTSGGSGTDVTLPNEIQGPGTLNAATSQYASDTRSAEKDALLLYSGIALGIMLVVSAVLGWFAAGRALRPLRRITAGGQADLRDEPARTAGARRARRRRARARRHDRQPVRQARRVTAGAAAVRRQRLT